MQQNDIQVSIRIDWQTQDVTHKKDLILSNGILSFRTR